MRNAILGNNLKTKGKSLHLITIFLRGKILTQYGLSSRKRQHSLSNHQGLTFRVATYGRFNCNTTISKENNTGAEKEAQAELSKIPPPQNVCAQGVFLTCASNTSVKNKGPPI